MKGALILTLVLMTAGCASDRSFLGSGKANLPPEFNQKVLLQVSDEYRMYQAPESGYDIGDLQSFHTQHTLPIVVEGLFKDIFGEVELIKPGAKIEMAEPEVPAIFEARILDLAHDIYDEGTRYRSQVVLAVAMKSPRGHIFWKKTVRGEGLAIVDTQFSTGLGPEEAILDAMRDALGQIETAIITSSEVRNQLKYYQDIDRARKEREITV